MSNSLFYASSEYPWENLPVECRLVRYLLVKGTLEKAAVLEVSKPIFNRPAKTFVALAKGNDVVSDAYRDKVVSVFLLEVDERVCEDRFDMERGLQPVLDWGVLTSSAETAGHWQVQ